MSEHAHMPARSPLAMPMQSFSAAPEMAVTAPAQQAPLWRIAVFAPAFITTALMVWGLHGVYASGEMSGLA